jgi:hypothetical protein
VIAGAVERTIEALLTPRPPWPDHFAALGRRFLQCSFGLQPIDVDVTFCFHFIFWKKSRTDATLAAS